MGASVRLPALALSRDVSGAGDTAAGPVIGELRATQRIAANTGAVSTP